MGSKNTISLSLFLSAILCSLVPTEVNLSEDLDTATQGYDSKRMLGPHLVSLTIDFKRTIT